MVWLFQCLLCLLKVAYPLVVKEIKMKRLLLMQPLLLWIACEALPPDC